MVTENGPQLVTAPMIMSPGTPMSVMSPGGCSTVSMLSSPRSVQTVIANNDVPTSNTQQQPPSVVAPQQQSSTITATIKVEETNQSSAIQAMQQPQPQSTNWPATNPSVSNQLPNKPIVNNGHGQPINNNNNLQLVNMQQNFYQNGPLTSPVHSVPCPQQQPQQQPVANNWNASNYQGNLLGFFLILKI